MDSVMCSELRDQPDVFDIDMPKDHIVTSSHQSDARRASCIIYDDNQEDEDMVDAHHVHELLSRVSSSESLTKLED